MAYPSKTTPEAIRRAALVLLEEGGEGALTIRGVAAALGVAPNALYRHYPAHEALMAAVAEEGTQALLDALRRGTLRAERAEPASVVGPAGAAATVRALARAYLGFARARPALYALVMARHEPTTEAPATHEQLWAFIVGLLEPVTGPADAPAAGVALWAFLHGMVGLDQVAELGGTKPRSAARRGLDALLAGLAGLAVRAPDTP